MFVWLKGVLSPIFVDSDEILCLLDLVEDLIDIVTPVYVDNARDIFGILNTVITNSPSLCAAYRDFYMVTTYVDPFMLRDTNSIPCAFCFFATCYRFFKESMAHPFGGVFLILESCYHGKFRGDFPNLADEIFLPGGVMQSIVR